jgi:L-cysteine desulfidase
VVYAREMGVDEETMLRALLVSDLMTIHQKTGIGCLSAYCGAISAGCGAGCGICYLNGGRFYEIAHTLVNAVAILSGTICDGAKPSCALKLTSGVSTAVLSAMLAMQGNCVSSVEGIIDDDVDQCVRNLVAIGADSMNETDKRVLHIMTHKTHAK